MPWKRKSWPKGNVARTREAIKLAYRLGIPPEEVFQRWTEGQHYCSKHGWHKGYPGVSPLCPDCHRAAVARVAQRKKEKGRK